MEKDIINEIEEYNKNNKPKIFINSSQLNDVNFIEQEFFQKEPIIYDMYRIWWQWNKHLMKWEKVDDTQVTIAFNKIFYLSEYKNQYVSSVKSMIINALKNQSRIFQQKFIKEIKDTWVVFKDVIVDVATGERFKNSYKYFSTNPIPYNISNLDDTSTPTIDKLLNDWVGNNEGGDWSKTLKELMAYTMLPSYPIEATFVLHGNGSNGKSTFLTMLARFIGYDNITSMDLESLTNSNNRFYTSKLFKKLVCVMGEIDDTVVKHTGLLKSLVSGKDSVSCEFKGKDAIDFINYAKIIMATNNLPMTADLSDAYYRRFIIVDFYNKFEANGLVSKSIPEEEFENLARQLIPLLQNILKKYHFENEGDLAYKKKRYEERSNPIQAFIKEYCDKDENGYIPVFEFAENLEPYLSTRNYKIMSKKAVTQVMKSVIGIESQLKRVGENKNPWRCYIGLKWKPEAKFTETKYDEKEGIFNNIENLSIDDYENKTFTRKEIYEIFKSFDHDTVDAKIKSMKTQGHLLEYKHDQFRFRKGVLGDLGV